jgi:uncharacterized damage-inducible protein DinB
VERIRRVLVPVPGTRSPLAGRFLWQLDDQSRRLTEDTRGATADELAWQPAPGVNTIGMLLAHVAAVEVRWTNLGVLERARDEGWPLPIAARDIGVPLAAGGAPPAALAGRELPFFDDLLARARTFTKQALAPLGDADLERRFHAAWSAELEVEGNLGWTLYHLLEHEAGHYGQINLLRHLYRESRGRA